MSTRPTSSEAFSAAAAANICAADEFKNWSWVQLLSQTKPLGEFVKSTFKFVAADCLSENRVETNRIKNHSAQLHGEENCTLMCESAFVYCRFWEYINSSPRTSVCVRVCVCGQRRHFLWTKGLFLYKILLMQRHNYKAVYCLYKAHTNVLYRIMLPPHAYKLIVTTITIFACASLYHHKNLYKLHICVSVCVLF